MDVGPRAGLASGRENRRFNVHRLEDNRLRLNAVSRDDGKLVGVPGNKGIDGKGG